MKIMQIINVRWYNATAWYCVTLSELLRKAGHQVLVVGEANTPPLLRAADLGLTVHPLELNSANPLVLLRTYSRMRRLVRRFAPDVVNCHRGESFFLWGLLRKQWQSFALVRTRGDQRPPKSSMGNRWLHNNVADAVILTNSAAAEHCRNVLQTPPNQLWTIYGGVDTTIFRFDPAGRARVRQEFDIAEDDFLLGLVGRFDEVKGQRELLQALANLRDSGLRHLACLLIGHDSALPATTVESWIRDMGLVGRVQITGPRTDVPACISALDLGIAPSLWSEAIARAALEIMACGRPLLASNVGVMPDLLDSRALFPPGDVDAMQSRIARAVGDADYRDNMLRQQQQRISQLSSREFLRQSLNVYQQALEAVPRRGAPVGAS